MHHQVERLIPNRDNVKIFEFVIRVGIMRKQLTFSTIFLFSSSVFAQGVVLECYQDSLLFPKQTLSNDTQNLDVLADRSEISQKNNYLLTGNVSINSSQYFLSADKVIIDKSAQTSNATGSVQFQDDELMLSAQRANIQKQDNKTITTIHQAQFHYPETKINGYAEKITNDGVKQVFNSANYSLCPLNRSDWRMNADEITLNSSTNRGSAKDVSVEFFGVPIFYSPYHEWVLEGRGSGFLAPSFGRYDESISTEDDNYQVRIPYYFNIAPDRDFLLTLNHLSSRGSVIEGKYRQLIAPNRYWQDGRVEVEGHYLDQDDITQKQRWLLNSKLNLSINPKTQLNLTTKRVSDINYFKEIAHDNTSASALNSHIDVSYNDDQKNLNLAFFAESEQLINSGNASYTRAPEVSVAKSFEGLGGRHIDLSLISTKFSHKNNANTTGVRTHAQANFKRAITTPAYALTPHLNLSTTDYALDNAPDESRSIYSFGLDSKLFLEREMRLFSTNLIQTLTPRLAYNYTPKKTDPNVNFDSESKSDSYESLFSGQKFTGIDRIGKANDLTAGIESEFIDEATGETYLSLKSAQTFYGDAITTNGGTRKYSDIALSANFSLNNFTFDNTLQYDPETNKIDKRDSSVSYLLNPRKFLTLAHHYDRDNSDPKSIELYGAYPLTKQMHVFAGVNRSQNQTTGSWTTSKETTGIAYESCCWALRLAHFKEHISGNDYDYVTDFELVLKGLATSTPGLSKRLEVDIPNYLANLDE